MDTIYSLFQNIVKENYDKTSIIENTRSMTFGELSDMVDFPICWQK